MKSPADPSRGMHEADAVSAEPPAPSAQGPIEVPSMPDPDDCVRQVAEHLGDVFWMTNADRTELIYVSPTYTALLGRSLVSAFEDPSSFVQAIHPDDRERVVSALPRQLEGTYAEEYRIVRPDGTIRRVLDRAVPIRDENGLVCRVAGVMEDVTGRLELESQAKRAAAEATARQEAEAARAQVTGILERITDGFLALDREWRFTYVNRRAEELLGLVVGSLAGRSLWETFPWMHDSMFGLEFERAVRDRVSVQFEAGSTGVDRWFAVNAFPDEGGLSVYIQDVSERKRAEHELRESERRYRSLFEEVRDAIYRTRANGEIVDANPAFLELLGYAGDNVIGLNAGDMYAIPSDRERFKETVMATGATRNFEVRLRRKDGIEIECIITASLWHSPTGDFGFQGTIRDITERKRHEALLRRHALHDSLTDLPNRAYFLDRLGRALERVAVDAGYHFAVLFLDLDRFKVVNDSLGHMAGDELLVEVARRLESAVRPGDTVARLGGDEFAVLLYDFENRDHLTAVAERIQNKLRQPHLIGGQEVFTTASIGIALSSAEYDRPEEILRDADTAMYRAKALGGVRYQTFDHTMHAEAMALLHLETDLRRAVEREEFEVYYQPIVALDTGATIGFEALARWRHPERGIVLPAEFIPLAEETGLIIPIGWAVLREACETMAAWNARLRPAHPLMLSVNLSARQLMQPDLSEVVQRTVAESGLTSGLRLEITESAIMAHPDAAAEVFHELRDAGIELCIDDFGTGYSSLSHLHRFPVTLLKIDRSFVHRLGNDAYNLEIVRAIVTLAANLGIDAIAEGVETTQQRDRLRSLGSRLAQGFLFSRPLPKEAAEARLEEEFGAVVS